ncbi:MAG: UDP-N-acetylglucosamine 2-epimerase (non-hydrolyzing) [Variovorax sp.]|nr:MAG: UDP-N-acetylglucosamine 2-epimerase (non-hydrolyzing) [Variovorax sp.]
MSVGSVILCMGTRPEIIKMAPVHRALRASRVPTLVLHTGQHDQMAWPLYEFFDMRPDHVLPLERRSDSLAHLTAVLTEQSHRVLAEARPAAVLVQGDTTSALVGALTSFYLKIPVGHVEAGLRTFDIQDPFPEEANRQLIGRLARWHFPPTRIATANLRREGIAPAAIHQTGNTIVDATHWGVAYLQSLPDGAAGVLPPELAVLPAALGRKRIVLVTAHRRENWGQGIESIARGVRRLLASQPGLVVVWPVHANPQVRETVHRVFEGLVCEEGSQLLLTAPLNYPALLWVMSVSWLILSDSGGIQEEAVSARVPILVLRETTERPELIAAGAGKLVGTDADRLCREFIELQDDRRLYERMRGAKNPFGDGRAAARIAEVVSSALPAPQPTPVRVPHIETAEAGTP